MLVSVKDDFVYLPGDADPTSVRDLEVLADGAVLDHCVEADTEAGVATVVATNEYGFAVIDDGTMEVQYRTVAGNIEIRKKAAANGDHGQ